MLKSEYREYFAGLKNTIKINYFLKQCNINQRNFSLFMTQKADFLLSVNKLDSLYNCVNDYFKKFV